MFKKILAKLGIGAKKAVEVADTVLDAIDWAEREIKEAEQKLIELSHRLHAGLEETESTIKTAKYMIQQNEIKLAEAIAKQNDIQQKYQQVGDLLNIIDRHFKKVVD
jgi:ABC-type nitrate/sulfonate/bicarbonate transport system substrate-binding protein